MDALCAALGDEVADAFEETFLLYSRPSSRSSGSSGNLGFIDPNADELEFHVAGKDLTIRQYPNLLVSDRAEGTTGAVLWKITPLFADWLASKDRNPLFQYGILGPSSKVIELGSGVAGIVLLALAPLVNQYIATDQQYVLQHLNRNIEANARVLQSHKRKGARRNRSHAEKDAVTPIPSNWKVQKLDWETDMIVGISDAQDCSAIIAVDCIYNETLIEPFVRTCADLCRFRSDKMSTPTICVIGQQLRSEDVFEEFMKCFVQLFHVWRIPEGLLSPGIRDNPSFVIHIGTLRTENDSCLAK